jgi:hypothetical protein
MELENFRFSTDSLNNVYNNQRLRIVLEMRDFNGLNL